MRAAETLVHRTPAHIINTPTIGEKWRPGGYTCLHFAVDSSDKDFARAELTQSLLDSQAEIEARDDKGNTPITLVAGVGATDVLRVLILARADVNATNDNGAGCRHKALESSTDLDTVLIQAGLAVPTAKAKSGKTRQGYNASRASRAARSYYMRK